MVKISCESFYKVLDTQLFKVVVKVLKYDRHQDFMHRRNHSSSPVFTEDKNSSQILKYVYSTLKFILPTTLKFILPTTLKFIRNKNHLFYNKILSLAKFTTSHMQNNNKTTIADKIKNILLGPSKFTMTDGGQEDDYDYDEDIRRLITRTNNLIRLNIILLECRLRMGGQGKETDPNQLHEENYDEGSRRIVDRINELINLNIMLLGFRLSRMSMTVNKYMKMYNGNKDLKIMYQNVPGNLSKSNIVITIQSILHRLNPDLLAIAEPSSDDLDIDWSPYVLLRGHIQGGKKIRMNVLIKSNLQFKQMHWNVEIPHVVVNLEGWKMIFAYREWAKCGLQSTKTLDSQLSRWSPFVDRWAKEKSPRTLLMGDMNFHYWGMEGSQKSLKPVREKVLEDVISNGWMQLVRENTRYQSNQIPSCLDHIYSRSTSDIVSIKNFNETGYDHNCIGVSINISKKIVHPNKIEYRDIEGIALGDFERLFNDNDLLGIVRSQDASEAAELLTHAINTTLNVLAPIKTRVMKFKTSAHWMTKELKSRIAERNSMRKLATEGKIPWQAFKAFRNTLKSDMMLAKKKFIVSQVSKENMDPKARWRAIKAATQGKRHQNDIILNTQSGVLLDPISVANHLNRYYVSKVEDIIEVTPPDPDKALEYTREYMSMKSKPQEFEFRCVSQYEVSKRISSIKQTGAVGHDMISTMVLKKFNQVLTPYITKVVNLSIMTSTYPQTWKYGIISPVPKGGDLTVDKNWRPVTLLPVLSKILEGILNHQLKMHMEQQRIMSSDQHAYRSFKSTDTAWADLDTRIQKATDTGKYVGLLLVDMSAAFNLVAKEIIVPKLKQLGVGDFAARLIFSYLTSRKSRVKIKGMYSAWIQVKTGIGEGSVLGPLIFILTIVCCSIVLYRAAQELATLSIEARVEDQPTYDSQVSLSNVKFADDVTAISVCDTEDQVQKSLQILATQYQKYFACHGLKINVTKSEHIVFGQKRTKTIFVDGRKEADKVKLLGLTVTKNYCFDPHVDIVAEKIAKRNGQLSKLSGIAGTDTLKMLAEATILSVATYGAPVYANDKKSINRLQIKLNKTMRMITNSRMKTHVADMLTSLRWLKFELVVAYGKVMLLHRILSTSSAPFIMMLVASARYQMRYTVRERDLRIAWNPRMARKGCKSFLATAVSLYNNLKILGKVMTMKAVSKYVKSELKTWKSI